MMRFGKIVLMVVGAALTLSTPLVWLLGGPDGGQLVAASVQGAAGVGALVWALLSGSGPDAANVAIDTGAAGATAGGQASTGIRGSLARGTAARAERTGDATADGPGSQANTGVDSR